MVAKVRTSPNVKALVKACQSGQRLCKFMHGKHYEEQSAYYVLEPSGRPVHARTASGAIRAGLLMPAGDGLFGLEDSQTWVAPNG